MDSNYPRIEPPRKTGRSYKTTTMAVRVDTRDLFDGCAERWECSRFAAMHYMAQIGSAGYVDPPAPEKPVTINSPLPAVPKSIEAQAVAFVRAILPQCYMTPQGAEARVVELIRLAGCEARASWVKEEAE